MEKEHSKLEGILQTKCPRCRQGEIFTDSIISLNFTKTHSHCPHCQMRYEREPGFFWSAMYFSYAFSVAHLIIAFAAINIFTSERPPIVWFLGIIFSTFLLFVPVYFRYSRVLVLYLMSGVGYEPDPAKRKSELDE